MSSKEELTQIINKSMTISDIQKELSASKIDYTSAKKKADYVSLYITSGLHNTGRLSTIIEEQSAATREEKEPIISVAKK